MKKTKRFIGVIGILFAILFALSVCLFAACGSKDDDGDKGGDTGTTQDGGTTVTPDDPDPNPEPEEPEAHTHSLTLVPAKDAECETAGNKAYYTCDGCDKIFEDADGTTETTLDAVTIAALGHDYSVFVSTTATCTEAGKDTYKCSRCGKTEERDAVALGHDYQADESMLSSATCTEDGVASYEKCTRCGDVISETVPATGHNLRGTYDETADSGEGAWVYTCENDAGETTFDFENEKVNAVTLIATDEASLSAAGAWDEINGIVPVIEVNSTTEEDDGDEGIAISNSVFITGCEKVIVLNTDVSQNNCTVVIETTVTLDLNGHTMEKTTDTTYTGTIQIGAYSPDAVYGELTIKDTSTEGTGAITGIWYPVTIFGVTNTEGKVSVLTIEGGNITSTSGVAVSSNGLYPALEINIEGGNITNTSDYTAIYLPSGDIYVSGGHIEGATGIEIRGGSITVTGGEIVSNYTGEASYGSGTNGPVTRGYAIAENHPTEASNYPDVTGITISGGTISGTLIFTEVGKEVVNITGGLFSEDPSEFLGGGYSAVESTTMTGYYEIVNRTAPEAEVTGLAVADEDKNITLDVNQVSDEDQIQITVYITLSDGSYTTYESGLTWKYEGEGAITIDANGSSANITATGAGEGKITVSLDGTEYYVEIAVSVIDTTVAGSETESYIIEPLTDAGSFSSVTYDPTADPSTAVIEDNSLFTLTSGVKLTTSLADSGLITNGATFTLIDGTAYTPNYGITHPSNLNPGVREDNMISLTAKKDITVYMYFSYSNLNYNGGRSGIIFAKIDGVTVQEYSVSARATAVVFSVSLEKDETLTIGTVNTDNSGATPWFYGAEAVVSEFTGRGQAVITALELSDVSLSLILNDPGEGTAELDVYGLVTEDGSVLSGTFLDGYTFIWGFTGNDCVTIADGVVTATATGSATIYAYIEGNNSIYGICEVTVTEAVDLQPGTYTISVTYTFGNNEIISTYNIEGLASEYKATFTATGSSGLTTTTQTSGWTYGNTTYMYRAQLSGYSNRGFDIVVPTDASGVYMSFVFYAANDKARTAILNTTTSGNDYIVSVTHGTSDTDNFFEMNTSGKTLAGGTYYLYAADDSPYLLSATINYTITVE